MYIQKYKTMEFCQHIDSRNKIQYIAWKDDSFLRGSYQGGRLRYAGAAGPRADSGTRLALAW